MRHISALLMVFAVSGVLSAQPVVTAIPAVDGQSLNREDILRRHSQSKLKQTGPRQMAVFPSDNVLPQLVEGSYWSTALTFINMDTRTLKFTVYFVADDGSDLAIPVNGIGTSVRAVDLTLPVMNTITIQTPGTTSTLKQGFAYISRDDVIAGLGGFAVFRQSIPGKPDSEAVVPIVSELDNRSVLLFDNTNGFSTGIAIANPNDSRETLPITVRDESGTVLTTKFMVMESFAHLAASVPVQWPETAGKKGSIEFNMNGFGASVLGLRFHPSGAFTSFHALSNVLWLIE